MIRQGDIIDRKYKILTLIGKGGMSKVWLALDTRMNKQWAIKEIDKSVMEYKMSVNEKQTLTEIEIMKRLDHPALPRILDVIDEKDSLSVVMDYIEGESLLNILNMYGKQKEEIVASWMLELCDILSYLHSQNPPIIYRDVKPSNLMLNQDGHIKVIDFGIAREYKGNKDDTLPLGTNGYASPEHFTKHTDARSDIYSVGATMFQLLTGKDPAAPPFIVPVRTIDPTLSTGLEKIVLKATARNPEDRYQSASEMANAIESYKKLEEGYIISLENKIFSFKRKLIASILIMAIGAGTIGASVLIDSRNYDKYISTTASTDTERISDLKKAIEIKPGREEAYISLIETFSSDGLFTEKESSEFLAAFNNNKDAFSRNKREYAEACYKIGEAYLQYYTGSTDNSSRSKLFAAEPYFKLAKENGCKNDVLTEGYLYMADCYRNYVLSDDSLLASKSANKDDYREFLDNAGKILNTLDKYDGKGKEKMKYITFDLILSLLDSMRIDMQRQGISEGSILELINFIAEKSNDISNVNIGKSLYKNINDTKMDVTSTYERAQKGVSP